jgi:hypothetical protein
MLISLTISWIVIPRLHLFDLIIVEAVGRRSGGGEDILMGMRVLPIRLHRNVAHVDDGNDDDGRRRSERGSEKNERGKRGPRR